MESSDPLRTVLRDVVSHPADEHHEAAPFREVFRASNAAAVSVFERSDEYRVRYSLRDIHHLTFLSHDEQAEVERDWHAWHRRYVRLGPRGTAAWVIAAGLAGAMWFGADAAASLASGNVAVAIPAVALRVTAALTAAILLATLPALLATLSARVLCAAYVKGYADGLTRGVHRALRITPDIERAMWEELHGGEQIDRAMRQSAGADRVATGT
jgi:hypothetical protein